MRNTRFIFQVSSISTDVLRSAYCRRFNFHVTGISVYLTCFQIADVKTPYELSFIYFSSPSGS
jgi:hypothetical protein